MVKYFSVDWLAQSHQSSAPSERETPACRPHVPCMVQPRPPASGGRYLQLKPKASRPAQRADLQEPGPGSAAVRPAGCVSPVSEMSGYSSGYESEAASSECPSVDETEKEPQQRRVRTKFTTEQIAKLEKIFSKHKYLDAGERMRTAQRLGLTETQVRTWFQNRRMKLKREMQDCFAAEVPQVMFRPLPLVPFQHQSMLAQQQEQHHYHPPAGQAVYLLNVPHMVPRQPPRHQPYFY
ncbi:homeobox protein vent1 [Takifugu rubripes]|uniref:Ventral homeobox n=1 Tax=Takifugu rubripes TaxID=31033 RepID=H2TRX2_TAKRU|nr:homeobox protein vent1 [Takifugu rubripes]|eukprot:XP_003963708.1 PREDICTED: homeobox protein VENTX [Takifugu rubripes]